MRKGRKELQAVATIRVLRAAPGAARFLGTIPQPDGLTLVGLEAGRPNHRFP